MASIFEPQEVMRPFCAILSLSNPGIPVSFPVTGVSSDSSTTGLEEMDKAVKFAEVSPLPAPEETLEDVFA